MNPLVLYNTTRRSRARVAFATITAIASPRGGCGTLLGTDAPARGWRAVEAVELAGKATGGQRKAARRPTERAARGHGT
jgi:hypothetical protein